MKTQTQFSRTLKTLLYAFMAAALMFNLSCSPENGVDGINGIDGEQGPQGDQGPAGQDGEDGTDGQDGQDGTDGQDGEDGTDGQDGQDGNANVQTITFDASGFSGFDDFVSIDQLTADEVENDAILTYLSNGGVLFPVPCPSGYYDEFNLAVKVNIEPYFSYSRIYFSYTYGDGSMASISAGDLESGKVVIIESSSTTSNKMALRENGLTPTELVKAELKTAGVDINDYHAVCEYYGIAP